MVQAVLAVYLTTLEFHYIIQRRMKGNINLANNFLTITCGIPLDASQNHLSCCLSPLVEGASLRCVSVVKEKKSLTNILTQKQIK